MYLEEMQRMGIIIERYGIKESQGPKKEVDAVLY